MLLHGQLERFSLDPRLTARAIQNLLRNAMRYCGKRIQIGVQVNAEGCEIWVDDDGIGIPDDERERIFEPFYRLDRSRDRATGGFGLGLAISRRALETQGGMLTVEASPWGGRGFGCGCRCRGECGSTSYEFLRNGIVPRISSRAATTVL